MKLRKKSQIRSRLLDAAGGGRVLLARLFAPTIGLVDQFKLGDGDEEEEKPVPKYKWLHVASEGEFDGHADGSFKLDSSVFQEFIDNFHADPRYKAPTGAIVEGEASGLADVIPFDFEHASELAATEGSIPATGAPAPAWAMEVEMRDGPSGKQLWAYAHLGKTIRKYIASNEYRHVSIAFALDSADPESAESIGARLSSIAFTNHPFLRGLTSIAAKDSGAVVGQRLLYWYDTAGSPEQGMEYTRKCLGLNATADANAVKAEITKIAGFAAAPATTPPGVDLDDIFSGLRKIWGLPVSATVPEIVAEIDKAAGQIDAANAAATPAPALTTPAPAPAAATPPPATTTPAPVAASETEESKRLNDQRKKDMTLLQKLIALLKKTRSEVNLQNEDDVVRAVGEVVDVALAAPPAEKLQKLLADAADLSAILTALGKTDAAAALAALPDLMSAKAQLTSALQQLEEAMSMQAEVDTSMEDMDAEAAAEAKDLAATDPTVITALKAHRTSVISAEIEKLPKEKRTPKALREARQTGRATFLSQYGVVDERKQRLLKNLVAGPNGTQLAPPAAQSGSRQLTNGQRDEQSRQLTNTDKTPVITLTGLEGSNLMQRLMTHVRLNEKGYEKADHDKLFTKARAIKTLANRGEVVLEDETDLQNAAE